MKTKIKSFWKWFQDNEQAIHNAILLDINTKEVIFHLNRNCKYISKKIVCIAIYQADTLKIIFSLNGNKKLLPKLIALEEKAPKLSLIKPQFIIKPITSKEIYLNKKDDFLIINNQTIKISDLYLQLDNYNTTTKKLDITIYHPYKKSEKTTIAIHIVTQLVIGEIAYNKHIRKIENIETLKIPIGLLPIVDLDEFINYLYE